MRLLPVLFLVALLPGCAVMPPDYVYVDSVASRAAEGMKRYVLLARPGRYQDAADSLPGYVRKRHEGFVALAHDVLASAGFEQVQSQEAAELVVALDYGVDVVTGPVRTERTSSVQLAAFDWEAVREDDRRNAIWRTRAWMDGSSGGLSRVVPILLESLRPYVGTSTDGAVEVVVE